MTRPESPIDLLRAISGVITTLSPGADAVAFTVPGAAPLGMPGRRIALSADFESLPLDERVASAALDTVASTLPLIDLRRFLHRATRLLAVGGIGHFVTLNPDRLASSAAPCWPGSRHGVDGATHRYRPLRQLHELLRLFPVRMLTPVPLGDPVAPDYLWIRFVRTDADAHLEVEAAGVETTTDRDVKYGVDSSYRQFDRLEEPEILDDLCFAASRLRAEPGEVVLSLGCNDARELEMFDPEPRRTLDFIGIDVAPSAIEAARRRFPDDNYRFLCEDLAALATLALPTIDIALVLGVLQCTSVDRDRLLIDLMRLLGPKSRLLVSIPNCHFGPSDILRRPLDRRTRRHDRSPIHKDLRFLTRYFYRQGFRRIESFGTYDAFLLIRR